MTAAVAHDLKSDISLVLNFYKALGFESLPLASADADKEAALMALRHEIGDCKRCKLSKGRTNLVFGEGNPNARIMFVGEAPGREEDKAGRPFVGEAGQLLTRLINKMGEDFGFTRNDVYIANIAKCRPPGNRDPEADEIETCFPFLKKQVAIIAPEVIVSLGRISAHTMLGRSGPFSSFFITKERGKFGEYKDGEISIPVMPTFHPAYLLRTPSDKVKTWGDAQAVLKLLKHPAMRGMI
ncbi:MAG: uracil-DNA glycosylase [Nitrospirae bacterium]|nr:MAG: uracil-DNA glycosylase [Nitrospirota bacterium]